MGAETRVVVPWTDVRGLDLKTKMLLANGIVVHTRTDAHQFYMLMHRDETLALMRQLAAKAMRRMLDVEINDRTVTRARSESRARTLSRAAETMPPLSPERTSGAAGESTKETLETPRISRFRLDEKRQQEIPQHQLKEFFYRKPLSFSDWILCSRMRVSSPPAVAMKPAHVLYLTVCLSAALLSHSHLFLILSK